MLSRFVITYAQSKFKEGFTMDFNQKIAEKDVITTDIN